MKMAKWQGYFLLPQQENFDLKRNSFRDMTHMSVSLRSCQLIRQISDTLSLFPYHFLDIIPTHHTHDFDQRNIIATVYHII